MSEPVTIMIVSFRTDRSGQIVQTQIRLLLLKEQSDQGLHCLQIPPHLYSKVKLPCSTLRVITAHFWVSEFLGVLRYIYLLFYLLFWFLAVSPKLTLQLMQKTNLFMVHTKGS